MLVWWSDQGAHSVLMVRWYGGQTNESKQTFMDLKTNITAMWLLRYGGQTNTLGHGDIFVNTIKYVKENPPPGRACRLSPYKYGIIVL